MEAKREEIDANKGVVCDQVEAYARGVPSYYTAYQKPIPFLYTSNGKQHYFHDFRKKDSGYEEIFVMHKPKKLVEMLGIEDPFAGLPTLNPKDQFTGRMHGKKGNTYVYSLGREHG